MDKEIMEFLEQFKKEVNQRFDKLENKIDIIDNKVSELEPLNAKRHIEIACKIDRLITDLNVVEAVSGKNLADIAILKSVK